MLSKNHEDDIYITDTIKKPNGYQSNIATFEPHFLLILSCHNTAIHTKMCMKHPQMLNEMIIFVLFNQGGLI